MNRVIENAIKNLEIQAEYSTYKPQRDALLSILCELRGVSSDKPEPDYGRHGEIFRLGWRERNAGNDIHYTTHTYDAYNKRGYTFFGYRMAMIAEGKKIGGAYVGKKRSVKSPDYTKGRKVGVTGYRGVHVIGNKYQARRTINGKYTHLGTFSCPIEAHNAYLAAKGV